jgi:hypothetical protein
MRRSGEDETKIKRDHQNITIVKEIISIIGLPPYFEILS